MRYLSVCSGIEAATVAWHPLGWSPVAFAEIDNFPSAVLAHHYPTVPNWGDITRFKEWPDATVDLLVGGTPCQSFSIAGLRKGLADPRGNLSLTFLGIADRYRPEWVVWENVPGVLSSGEGRDFGAFLGGLAELGYGWAYRVLDAQYVRVDGFGRAVPQRRRRVFVIGNLGDWRRSAAVLFEPESLSGNPAPRREAGQGIAPTISSRPTGGGGLGADFDLDGGLVARCVTAGNQRLDPETDNFVVVNTLSAARGRASARDHTMETYIPVAHALRADGFDASEDGTGRGTPIIASFDSKDMTMGTAERTSTLTTNGDENHAGGRLAIAFSSKDHGADAGGLSPTLRAMGHSGSHANAGGQVAVAFDMRGREGGSQFEGPHETANIRAASGGSSRSYVASSAVRRLTPVECERLQGFPDFYTAVPYRGKPAADGPRYKALGNSMAVPVMRWIGERIEMVRQLLLAA